MKCPNCNNKLIVAQVFELRPEWATRPVAPDTDVYEIQYNCGECTYDWKVEVHVPHNTEISPIFWG
jgi:hypothetical protein